MLWIQWFQCQFALAFAHLGRRPRCQDSTAALISAMNVKELLIIQLGGVLKHDASQNDIIFTKEVQERIRAVSTEVKEIPLAHIKIQPDKDKTRLTRSANVIKVANSFKEMGIDLGRVQMLVRERDDGYELLGGNHRYEALNLLRNEHHPAFDALETYDGERCVPAVVLGKNTTDRDAKLYAVRDNVLNGTAKSMTWVDYISTMIHFPLEQVQDTNFKTKFFEPATSMSIQKRTFGRNRKRAVLIVEHDCVDLWKQLANNITTLTASRIDDIQAQLEMNADIENVNELVQICLFTCQKECTTTIQDVWKYFGAIQNRVGALQNFLGRDWDKWREACRNSNQVSFLGPLGFWFSTFNRMKWMMSMMWCR